MFEFLRTNKYAGIFIVYGLPLIAIITFFMDLKVIAGICFWSYVIIMVIGTIYTMSSEKDVRVKLNEKLQQMLNDVKGLSQTYISKDFNTAIGINEDKNEIYLIRNKNYDPTAELGGTVSIEKDYFNYEIKKYSFSDILKSEVLEDDQSVVSTSRGSQIGGALLGGILAGGVGAIIGGLSASQTIDKKVKCVKLNIIINDTENPLRTIVFLNEVIHINKYENKYEKADQEVKHWHSLVSILIKKADKDDKAREKTEDREFQKELHKNNNSNGGSVADELKKLKNLVDEGILTIEEFEAQKKKLLSQV